MTPRHLPPGVAATSGGTFNPDSGFLYYIASNPAALVTTPDVPQHHNVLVAVNELDTPKMRDALDRLLDTPGVNVLLDSGIFNLAMGHARHHGTHMDEALRLPPEDIDGFTELWDRYAQLATTYLDRLWGIIELDQGGSEHKPHTRTRIHNELGFTPIPVYHPLLDGWDYYDTIAATHDRICFGNLVKASPPIRLRLVHTASERARKYPHLWTHLLGVYPNENLLAMPLRGSADSSSWLTSVRWMPSWKAWSMTKMVSHYPTDMWYADRTGRIEALNHATANALQTTLTTIGTQEATHTWLTHP